MGAIKEIFVPDIGDFKDVAVIELMVKPGDRIKAEDPLIMLESDKAALEVPAPSAGVIRELKLSVGDTVSQGSLILLLDAEAVEATAQIASIASTPVITPPPEPVNAPQGIAEVRIPAIGDFEDVPVVEIMVKPGDTVRAEQALLSLESDKATMEVPAPLSGVIQDIKIKLGDKVSEGTVIMTIATNNEAAATLAAHTPVLPASPAIPAPAASSSPQPAASSALANTSSVDESAFALAYAGPGVRKLARELAIDLGKVKGSGDKGRILKSDLEAARQNAVATPATKTAPPASTGAGFDMLPWPKVDFAKFGTIESKPLARIKKLSGANLHRNWVMIPHVTNHDDADITEIEAFRTQTNAENEKSGVKLSMLAFMIKASVQALKKFPEFNASLDGDNLILKRYYHIGFAADTPNGLVVPVIRDADQKGVIEIGNEMNNLAKLARDGKLKSEQMQGGCFTISSLGGIGGMYFTPIINAPEVAILGVCRSYWKQVSPDGKQSAWRLMLPLSLSWDHRVIDGAAAARFNAYFANLMADMRRIIL